MHSLYRVAPSPRPLCLTDHVGALTMHYVKMAEQGVVRENESEIAVVEYSRSRILEVKAINLA